jgi:hypothetical protein
VTARWTRWLAERPYDGLVSDATAHFLRGSRAAV